MNESKSYSDVKDTALVLTTVLQAQTENEQIHRTKFQESVNGNLT